LAAAPVLAQQDMRPVAPIQRSQLGHDHPEHPAGTHHPLGPSGPTQTVAYSFCASSNCADGSAPNSLLMMAADGNYYGTTTGGGANNTGAIFQFNPRTSTYQVLYSFCSQTACADGQSPYSGLVQDAQGNLWGTTLQGGANLEGTIYEITTGGVFNVVYSFCSQSGCTDGDTPFGGLTLASDGNLYGMTFGSGNSYDSVIYRITPDGTYTELYSWCTLESCDDGWEPYGDMVQGSDGNLYGTTSVGGSQNGGVVFSMGTDGSNYTVLYPFCSLSNCADGGAPGYGKLVQASDGSFYGQAQQGGVNGAGTIFKVTPAGTYTDIYDYCSATGCADGGSPNNSTLIYGSDGNLYGVAAGYGVYGNGAFFELSSANAYTNWYSFCALNSCPDGSQPNGGVIQAQDGSFYGVTQGGGANQQGVIYNLALSPTLPAPMTISVPATLEIGQPATLSFTLSHAYSLTMQQCYAFATQQFGAGTVYPLGKVPVTLSNGVLSGSLSGAPNAPVGDYLFAVTCGGTQTVTANVTLTQPVATTLTLSHSPGSVISGATVDFTANVAASDSSTVNVGTVAISCNGFQLPASSVSANSAALDVSTAVIAEGSYVCTGTFTDPTNTYAASSASTTVTVTNQTTQVTLTPASGNLTQGQQLTLTATLSGNGFQPNYGTVTFSTPQGWSVTVPVDYDTGTASISGPLDVPSGTYVVTATYSGAKGANGSSTSQTYAVFP